MNQDIRFYWKLLLRRSPVMLAIMIIGSAFGLVTALKLPPEYSASARLLVEAPQIPDELASSTVRTEAGEQLQIIEQRLLTRANLIDVANEYGVFVNQPGLNPDQVVQKMREATRIQRQSGREQATLMTLSFRSEDPRVVANVVNAYTTLVLEANNEFRMSRAESTLQFFEQEVRRLGDDLDRKSVEVVDFRNAHKDALPESLDYRRGRQTQLQEREVNLDRELAAIRAKREEIVNIYEKTGRIRPQTEATLSPDEQQLSQLQAELDQALVVYSENNPKIKILKGRIQQLETTIANTAPIAGEDGETINQEAALLEIALAEIRASETLIEEEIARIQTELTVLQQTIDDTAANRIELGALERDYENLQLRYNSAVNNLNQARLGERIEVTSQGQRVTVIEGATVPTEPSGPNRTRIAVMGVGGGLGGAFGFFALLELLNRTIRRPAELTSRFQIIPIATIPYMESKAQKRMRRSAMAMALLAVMAGVPATLYYIDTYYMPLDLLASKVVEKLGLT